MWLLIGRAVALCATIILTQILKQMVLDALKLCINNSRKTHNILIYFVFFIFFILMYYMFYIHSHIFIILIWPSLIEQRWLFDFRPYVTSKKYPQLAAMMILCPTTRLGISSEVSVLCLSSVSNKQLVVVRSWLQCLP